MRPEGIALKKPKGRKSSELDETVSIDLPANAGSEILGIFRVDKRQSVFGYETPRLPCLNMAAAGWGPRL